MDANSNKRVYANSNKNTCQELDADSSNNKLLTAIRIGKQNQSRHTLEQEHTTDRITGTNTTDIVITITIEGY